MEISEEVKRAYRKKVLFTIHALNQMNAPDRMISRRAQLLDWNDDRSEEMGSRPLRTKGRIPGAGNRLLT